MKIEPFYLICGCEAGMFSPKDTYESLWIPYAYAFDDEPSYPFGVDYIYYY
jgi:hypothetical protein